MIQAIPAELKRLNQSDGLGLKPTNDKKFSCPTTEAFKLLAR